MKSKIDIFRPIAAVTRGCRGIESDHSSGGHLHCTIFRKKRQGSSKSGQITAKVPSDDDSFVISYPAEAWPPVAIPGSESIDSKSTADKRKQKLDRSVPLQTTSSDSRGAATPTLTPQHPSYYKIEMQGSKAQLSAGDDNSVKITPDHNDNIKSTGTQSRNITRAPHIAEEGLELPRPPLKAHEMGTKWTVSENGDIIAIPQVNRPAKSTPLAPSAAPPTFHEVIAKLGVPSLNSDDSGLPILTKASSDSMSETDSHSNEFGPESPPRMNRELLGHKSLFQEEGSSSSGRQSSKGSRSTTPTGINIDMSRLNSNTIMADKVADAENEQQQRKPRGCVLSQILDLFNYTCGVGAVCRDANCFSSGQAVAVA